MLPFASSKASQTILSIDAWLVEVAAIQNALGKQVIVRCFVVVPNLDGKAISSFLEWRRKQEWMLKKRVVFLFFFIFGMTNWWPNRYDTVLSHMLENIWKTEV